MNDEDKEAAGVTPAVSAYSDPRLVAVYDTLNPFADDTGFYLRLAAELSAASIVDIGCGTGLLTCELARRGHQMIGVDPSGAMLDVARHRPGGEQVRWIVGDARRLGEIEADLAIMTGHVAQVFLDDEGWSATLLAIRKALRPGGHLAFESRNPAVRPWTAWTPQASRRKVEDAVLGQIEVWIRVREVNDDLVRYEHHYLFAESGEEFVSTDKLRFRTRAELGRSLSEAGFSVESVAGDWEGHPADAASRDEDQLAARR